MSYYMTAILVYISIASSFCYSMCTSSRKKLLSSRFFYDEMEDKPYKMKSLNQIFKQNLDRKLLIKGIQENNLTYILMIIRKALHNCDNNEWFIQVLKKAFDTKNMYNIFIKNYCLFIKAKQNNNRKEIRNMVHKIAQQCKDNNSLIEAMSVEDILYIKLIDPHFDQNFKVYQSFEDNL